MGIEDAAGVYEALTWVRDNAEFDNPKDDEVVRSLTMQYEQKGRLSQAQIAYGNVLLQRYQI